MKARKVGYSLVMTIPVYYQKLLGISPGDYMELTSYRDGIFIRRLTDREKEEIQNPGMRLGWYDKGKKGMSKR
jgi:bifunctional DNA-binding transcriptional regulator/antitoxin component of YhaV-PrlF toxin-antitoxin module